MSQPRVSAELRRFADPFGPGSIFSKIDGTTKAGSSRELLGEAAIACGEGLTQG
jgi:hypothetical protein